MTTPAAIIPDQPAMGEMPASGSVLGPGLDLGDAQRARVAMYRDLLHARNQVTNLTAVRDLPGIERRLLLESLRLVRPIRALPRIDASGPLRLLDLGTGGGIPGIVLAIACPEIEVTLLDATAKKVAFLDDVIATIGLDHTTTRIGRAEEVGRDPHWRNQFDIVTARAVASLPALLELGLPLTRTGGHLVLPKGVGIDDELVAAKRAAALLDAEIVSADLLPDAGSTVETRLVIVRKAGTTPRTYPRRAGVPARNPLGTASTAGSGESVRGRRQKDAP